MEVAKDDLDFFSNALKDQPKLRWLANAIRFSRLIPLEEVQTQINEKIQRMVRRDPQLDQDSVAIIIQNLLQAKLVKRMQAWRVKHYEPKAKAVHREVMPPVEDLGVKCTIYKEKNFKIGRNPAILLPGFIPDGNEAFFLLRRAFLKYGPVFYVNYPTHQFQKEVLYQQLFEVISDLNRRKVKNAGFKPLPYLVGTSFGCSIMLGFLSWLDRHNLRKEIEIKGLVLLSPVLCLDDVCEPDAKRQKTLVGRAVSQLVQLERGDREGLEQAMTRARSIFSKMFSSGRDRINFTQKSNLSVMAIEDEVLRIFNPEFTPNEGVFERFMGLKTEEPLDGRFVTDLPTLVLFAEGESDVLTPNSPTHLTLSDPDKLQDIFPNGSVEVVYSVDEKRKVTHSDLIFQADRYLAHITPWLKLQS